MHRVRARITYANVVATLALFLALGGGAYAAATIGARDIKPDAVRSKHIKNEQVKGVDVAPGAIGGSQIADDLIYERSSGWTLGENDPRTNGKHAEISCDPGDRAIDGSFYTGSVNNPNHVQGVHVNGGTFELEWWVPSGQSGGYVAISVVCLDLEE